MGLSRWLVGCRSWMFRGVSKSDTTSSRHKHNAQLEAYVLHSPTTNPTQYKKNATLLKIATLENQEQKSSRKTFLSN